jgi:hypothetical protein
MPDSRAIKAQYRSARCSFRLRLSHKPRAVLKAPKPAAVTGPGNGVSLRVRAESCWHVRPTVVEMHRGTTTGRLSRQPQAAMAPGRSALPLLIGAHQDEHAADHLQRMRDTIHSDAWVLPAHAGIRRGRPCAPCRLVVPAIAFTMPLASE